MNFIKRSFKAAKRALFGVREAPRIWIEKCSHH